jgi:5-methylthioadenosine/S-adenosylhomocysteine deaminase
MLEAGIPVAMGIDSTALDDDEDMLREMRLALYLHREAGIAASVPDPYQILEMATIGGARAALLDDRIGTLEVGKKADVVLVSLERIAEPYLDPALDIVEAILTRGRAEDVDTVLVDGEILLDGGRLIHLDLPKILNRQREAAQRAQGTKSELRELLSELRTELIHFYRGWHRDENRDPYDILSSRG